MSPDTLVLDSLVYGPAQTLPDGSIQTIERLGPDEARSFLNNEGPQRKARKLKIDAYAADMNNGDWSFQLDPIALDRHGRMRNGQNRMRAVIKSGTSHFFVVRRNCSEAVISTLDTGMTRTLGDITRMKGLPYATMLAASSRLWWRYETDKFGTKLPSNTQAELYRDTHLESLLAVASLIGSAKEAVSLATPSPLCFVSAYVYEHNPTFAIQFLTDLDKGANLPETDVVFVLRRSLRNFTIRRAATTPIYMTAVLIKAINARYIKKPVKHIKFNPTLENFPTFAF